MKIGFVVNDVMTEKPTYTTTKNKKTMPEKLLIMKFDPKARKHVEYKEMKLK